MQSQTEYTLNDAQADQFEEEVKKLAEDWREQLLTQGFVSQNGPFRNDHIAEIDFIEWAERDGIEVGIFVREDILPVLKYHAREYLAGNWD